MGPGTFRSEQYKIDESENGQSLPAVNLRACTYSWLREMSSADTVYFELYFARGLVAMPNFLRRLCIRFDKWDR